MIKIGILGYTDGNGHPYSYSSIFNGYNSEGMKKCPFKSIPEYLSNHNSDNQRISGARVTHIWTQDHVISNTIAHAANILNVIDDPIEMIGEVDGIILARDDYESHLDIAKPFIEAGTNIFIDKPIAISAEKATEILNLEKFKGQIFTSSSLAYDPNVINAKKNLSKIGNIKYVYGSAPGSWNNYAIHLIDCLMNIFQNNFSLKRKHFHQHGTVSVLSANMENDALLKIVCMGGFQSPLKLTIVGEKGFFDIDFADPYHAFKNTLEHFLEAIIDKRVIRTHEEIIKSISFIEID